MFYGRRLIHYYLHSGSQQFTGAGPSSYHPMPPPGGYQGVYSYPPPPPPIQDTYNHLYGIAFTYLTLLKKGFFLWSVGWSQDNDEASFDDFTRLFATPAQYDDPSLHTPVALLRRPARDMRPPDHHSYSTDHVHAQRKRGRHGRGGYLLPLVSLLLLWTCRLGFHILYSNFVLCYLAMQAHFYSTNELLDHYMLCE